MGIVLFHKASERILHLDDGLEGSASNVISLTQIKYPTLSPLDLFGMLSTKDGRECLQSLRTIVDNKGTALCQLTTKRILHLEDGSTTYAVDVMSLILIKFLDSNQLDSFGILLTSNGRRCLPSLSNSYRRQQGDCLLIPQHYKEDPSLGIQYSRCDKLDPTHWERLESIRFVWNPFDQQGEDMFAKLA